MIKGVNLESIAAGVVEAKEPKDELGTTGCDEVMVTGEKIRLII